jgi:hypothetical protein
MKWSTSRHLFPASSAPGKEVLFISSSLLVDSLVTSCSKAKESVFSRAYFHMKTVDAVIAFHQGFDGHIFMDSRGKISTKACTSYT